MINELWPHQVEALTALRQSIGQGVRRIVLQSPTGSGKTRLSAAIVDGALRKGNRMAFVVPAIALVDQTVEAFYAEGIRDVGVIQASHAMTDWSRPVQVCSIQTLQNRGGWPAANIVVIDECHRLFEAHKRWLTDPSWQHVPFIGLSATPWTRGLGRYFQTLLIAATTQELIDKGYLSPFRVFATGHPDLSGVKMVAGDYHEGQLSDAMQAGTLTADIVDTWRQRWNKDKTLCFCVDRAHAQLVQARFESAGISCGYQDANTLDDERREIKRKFHRGEYQVVVNISTLTTGVDWDCRCLILARPTRSEMLFVQIIGRALRTAEGKQSALILDHSDTTQRLGFVTDIHHDCLDDGKPKAKATTPERKVALPKECECCGVLKPARVAACPNCGHKPERLSGIEEIDGELIEIRAGAVARQKRGASRQYSVAEKRTWYAQLLGHARDHGYKDGWAANQYREKFEVWPRGMDDVTATAPTLEVASWIKSRQIAWAKSRRRQDRGQMAVSIQEVV